MHDELELKGYWWLPGNQNVKIAGTLAYVQDNDIVLEIIGSFYPEQEFARVLCNGKTEKIIIGITSDAQKVTLYNCFAYGSRNCYCDFSIVKYKCQFIIIGKHLSDFRQKCFFKANIFIPELSHWSPPSMLHMSIHKDVLNYSFKCGENIVNSVPIDDNTSLTIKNGVIFHSDPLSPEIEQCTFLEISKVCDASVDDFYSNIFLFEQFLSLATLHTVLSSQIKLYDKSEYQEDSSGEKIYRPINLLFIKSKTIESTKLKPCDFLFNLDQISNYYPIVIKKWYKNNNEIAPIRAHLIDSIVKRGVFSSNDFLIVVQAIEGFCTRFRKEATLSEMTNNLIAEFSGIDRLRKDAINVEQVVDSRHYYSHFMNKNRKPNALDGWELFNLMIKLRKLLVCCVLDFTGFDKTEINNILNRCDNDLFEVVKISEQK